MDQWESVRRFLKWILGATSPTIYVSFWKKKRESSRPDIGRARTDFCIAMAKPIYALILAGGSGERFWPLSRRVRPKQLLRLVSKKTLLEETVARLDGLVSRERILILTNVEQEAAVRKLLADFPSENVLAEPAKRDTAAAGALCTGLVGAPEHAPANVPAPAPPRHLRS